MSIERSIKVKDLLQSSEIGDTILVKGWVRTKRQNKHVVFITVNDGSTINNIQLVANPSDIVDDLLKRVTTGAAISARGEVVASQGVGQTKELHIKSLKVLGEADPDKYPLQPKKHSMEFLREIAYLRPRTNTFGTIFRIRHAMSFAVHHFFNQKGFINIHTPIITGSDAEGAGETFSVTALDLDYLPKTEQGNIDYKQDFFGKKTNLTVSGQLEGELAAMALGQIYTFGPTFRAENSNTTRHLAEFWMIEPEMAFADLNDNADLAEEMLQYLVQYALDHCADDLKFLHTREVEENKKRKKTERPSLYLLDRLKMVIDQPFERITYSEAIAVLKNSKPNKKKKFHYIIDEWGADLQSEHERYLVEKHFKKPVILTDYPKEIKSFYMRLNKDEKTVAAMDVLFPSIGEIIGGSQREERLDILVQRMDEIGISKDELWWYLDTRRFGSAPHSGFGLGFERMILFVTGMTNIRDVIPFPRTPGNAEF